MWRVKRLADTLKDQFPDLYAISADKDCAVADCFSSCGRNLLLRRNLDDREINLINVLIWIWNLFLLLSMCRTLYNVEVQKDGESRVGLVTFYMSLSVNYSDLKPRMTELTHSIAQQLDVNISQVHVMNFSTKGNGSLVKWAIFPAGSANYMSNATAMEIVDRLAANRLHLPDTFGSYELFEWGFEPPPKRTGWPQNYLIIVVAISVVLILGLSAFLGWLMWRRRQESSPLPYERVENVETIVREQELQPLK